MPTPLLQRTLLALVTCACAIASVPAHAQFPPPFLPPTAPILEAPQTLVIRATPNGGTSLTFQWRHGGLYVSYPRPATPTHFVICLGDPPTVASCDYPGQWAPAAGSIPSTPVAFGPGTAGQYRYTYTVPSLPDTYLDRTLAYRIGACSAPAAGKCTFSASAIFWLSTKNLRAGNISFGGSTTTTLQTKARAVNLGSTPTGSFFTHVRWYRALQSVVQMSGSCITDPNDAVVRPTDVVISGRGRVTSVGSLPLDAAGRRVAPADGIAGIHRPGTPMTTASGWFAALLMPGMEGIVADLGLNIPLADGRPISHVALSTIDSTLLLTELDETDNTAAECRTIQP